MAIVIRFNTLIVRKASIAARYSTDIDSYRSLYLPGDASFYYEDKHLIAHTSMGALYGVHDQLASIELIGDPDDVSADYCFADQENGVDGGCQWLKTCLILGLPVCWLGTDAPGYVVDFKSRRFVRHMTGKLCASCSTPLGLGAVAMALQARERREGPLAFIDVNRDRHGDYIVACSACNFEHAFSERGQSVMGDAM